MSAVTEDPLAVDGAAARRAPGDLVPRTLVLLAGLTLAAPVALLAAGALERPPARTALPWEIAILLASGAAVGWAILLVARTLDEKGERRPSLARRIALSLSTLAAALLVLAAVAAWTRSLDLPAALDGALSSPRVATLAILVALAPTGLFAHLDARRVRRLEARFPDFLRDINESHRVGLPLAQALHVASQGDYGDLNPEIRLMARQVAWGAPAHEALERLAARVGTPIIRHSVWLIVKATRMGGDISDVLAAAARDARAMQDLARERRATMSLYVIVVYVAFGVFLGVVGLLQGTLIPSLLFSTQATSGGSLGGVLVNARLGIADFELLYYSAGLVQAIGGGLVAGVLSEGTPVAGIKHAAAMAALTLVVLGFLV